MRLFRSFFHLSARSLAYRLIALALLSVFSSQAFGFNMSKYLRFKHGAVYSRAIIEGDNGQPIYGFYNEQGEFLEIGEVTGNYKGSRIMSGDTYRAYSDQLEALRELHGEDTPLISRNAYESGTFVYSTGETIQRKNPLQNIDTKFVLIRKEDQRTVGMLKPLILAEFPVDPTFILSETVPSVIVSEEGAILEQAGPGENIGYKVGFFGDEEEQSTFRRSFDDKIHGPIPGVRLEVGGGFYIGGIGATDEEGKYSMQFYLPPCPGFSFEYDTTIWAELNYTNFNPRGAPTVPYFLRRQDWSWCIDYASSPAFLGGGLVGLAVQANIASIEATIATPSYNVDFPVEVVMLTGYAQLANSFARGGLVSFGEDTGFQVEPPDIDPIAQANYDFDGDGADDYVEIGNIVEQTGADGETLEVFVRDDAEGELQGVYLSSIPREDGDQPHIIRLADTAPDFSNQGLLEQISEADLEKTDLYVFRKSNGQLIIEREGLDQDEIPFVAQTGTDDSRNQLFYKLLIRGPGDWARFSSSSRGPYTEWDSTSILDESLHARESDNLRAGEEVQIIMINRATGYIGTKTTTLQSAGSNGSPNIAVYVDTINMQPPNLKIYARRTYQVQSGLTADGKDRKSQIGFEGSALTDDTYVEIITEWYDHDGSPLPEALGDYGYTGRLAKVVAPNQLGSSLNEFSIRPGTHLEVLNLPGSGLGKEHFYIHVNGERKDGGEPNFGSTGQNEGILQYRPDKYVPFMVQLYDEKLSIDAQRAYRRAKEENPDLDLKKPEGIYQWFYRPEYQFSMFELTFDRAGQGIFAVKEDDPEENNPQINIYNEETPVIGSDVSFVEVFFSLLSNDDGPLEPFGAERELVMAFGEEEVEATISENGEIRFSNMEHLSSLEVDDFLTMRLYANNDASNTLWEWAFEYLMVDSLQDLEDRTDEDGTIYLSADDPQLDIQAILDGYADRDSSAKKPMTLRWKVDGQGTVEPQVQTDDDLGIFNTLLTLPTESGAQATLQAKFDQSSTITNFGPIVVVPGEPASINLQTTGEVTALGAGQLLLTATIRDQHNNLVADDTPVRLSVAGSALQNDQTFATVNGQVSTIIIGGEFAGIENEVFVTAGDITQQLSFEVHPVNVQIQSIAAEQNIGTATSVQVQVTDYQSQPMPNVSLTAHSTYGFIDNPEAVTDEQGFVNLVLVNPSQPGSATLSIRAGYAGHTTRDYEVVVPQGQSLALDTRQALVVGDQTFDGFLTYERFDGTDIDIDYPAQAVIELQGAPNSQMTVTVGDLADPNLAPVTAFFMNELQEADDGTFFVPEATGLYPAEFVDVEVVKDHPMGNGFSYSFTTGAFLRVDAISALQKLDNVGFRLDAKPTAAGTLFDHHDGTQQLVLTAEGRFQYNIKTDAGDFSIQSDPLSFGQWHTVAGRYQDGLLELTVDGQSYVNTQANGALAYSGEDDLKVGVNYAGNLNSVKFYDLSYAPLLALGNVGNEQSITVDLDSAGQATVPVRSLGHMNNQQVGSVIPLLSVAVSGGGERSCVNLLSSEMYVEVGSYYVDYVNPDPIPYLDDPIAGSSFNGQGSSYAFNALFPSAHAGFSISGVAKWTWGAINWIVPLEDIGILSQQLYYLATGDPKFDAVELSLSAIGTITIIPLAKPLKGVVKPLRRMVRFANKINPKFVRSFGSVIGGTASRAWKTKSFRVLLDVLPFMIMAGELMFDEEGREALTLIIQTVQSDDDLWAWIDYLRLPADGWEGGEEPPELDLVQYNPLNVQKRTQFAQQPFDFLVPSAYAAGGAKGRKVAKESVKKLVRALRQFDGTKASRRQIIDGISGVTNAMKKTDIAALRKTAFSPQTVAASARIGKNAISRLYRRSRNLRIPPFAIAAMITYLESRKVCDEGDTLCKPLTQQVRSKLDSEIIFKIFTNDLVAGKKDFIWGWRENGAAFHLGVLAYYQLSYEAGNTENQPLDIERALKVQLYKKGASGFQLYSKPYLRKTDIVLKGEGPGREVLVETKSYKRPVNDSYYSLWDFSKGSALKNELGDSKSNHKQFFLDRVAIAEKGVIRPQAGDFKWWFHNFKRSTISGYNNTDVTKALKKLQRLPKQQKIGSNSLGKDSGNPTLGLNSKVNPFELKRILLEEFKDRLFDGIEDEIYDSLVTNSTHDL